MNQSSSNHLSDQVVGVCPFGCNGKCPKLWINEEIGHKCDCTTCHSARVYPEEWYTSVDKYFVKNCTAERVAVGEWRGLPDTTSPPRVYSQLLFGHNR